jgi:hypothetical protein
MDIPFHIKMCIDRAAASKLIGPKGATIAHLRETTGTIIKLSKPEVVFPGTDKQVLLVGGEFAAVTNGIDGVLENVVPDEAAQKTRLELVIPNSSAPAMIGKGGNIIQRLRTDHSVQLKVYDHNGFCEERVMTIDGPLSGVSSCLREVCTILQDDGALKQFAHVDYRPAADTYYVQTMPPYGVKGKGGKGGEQYVDHSGYPVALPVPVVHPRAGKQGALAGMPPQVTDHQLAVCFNIAMSDIAKIGNVQKFGADLGTVVMLGDVGVDPDERSITVTGTLRACQATHARIVEAIPTES